MKSETWTPPPLILPGQEFSAELASVHGTSGYINSSYDNWDSDIEIPIVQSANNLGVFTTSNPVRTCTPPAMPF